MKTPKPKKIYCPKHGNRLIPTKTQFGMRYACPFKDCTVVWWDTGSPTTPADIDVRKARTWAHSAFDRWWKYQNIPRSEAYAMLGSYLNLPKDKTHIGLFDFKQCKKVVEFTQAIYIRIVRTGVDAGMRYIGKTIDNQPGIVNATWQQVQDECAKHKRFVLEVHKYDEAAEISQQQMKFWHAVVIKLYAEHTGYSEWKAEQFLKRQCGEQYFIKEFKEFSEIRQRGMTMFECKNPLRQQLFLFPKKRNNQYVCPNCYDSEIHFFFMLSKTELSVNDFTQVLQNTWDFLESINIHCPPPDREWRINNKKKKACKK